MRKMHSSLHLVILFLSFSCKAEVTKIYFNTDKPVVTKINSTSAPNHFLSFHRDNSTNSSYKLVPELKGQVVTTSKPTLTTDAFKFTQKHTTKDTKGIKSNHTAKSFTPTANVTCTADEKYKTGIIICVIIIAILVFIIAMLIICTVALANKISSLKAKLTQSKRHARSNGDFLSASSLLWSSGMETWQKKAGNVTMDEISLGDTNTIETEKCKLMDTPVLDISKKAAEENKSSPSATMTTISTVEV
ncbi:protein EVI2A [Hyla sarda]|uniref:protein EVI2A n=1 Tax=Hyla sarda TaxID=327740 RepID=UPI0024C293B7|nr:protein EVI2A [Hyla sarda]